MLLIIRCFIFNKLDNSVGLGGIAMIIVKIGARIRELRKSQDLSQEKFALKADIDRTYLAGIESGKRNPSIKNLEKIINTLGISFHQFFEGM